MPRKPRFYLPGVPCHVVQRGMGGEDCFFHDADYAYYLECLLEASIDHGCRIHAYVLMPNHIHLLLTPLERNSVSRLMQSVGRRYVQHVNRDRERTGSLWEGRHRASLVEEGRLLLACQHYIELNPVRAGLVDRPDDYRWSSYQWHGLGRPCRVLVDHPSFRQLGRDSLERQAHYLQLVANRPDELTLESIRATLNSGTPLGGRSFCRHVEKELCMKIGQLRRGRPRKQPACSGTLVEESS